MKRTITVLLVAGLLFLTMAAQALAADSTERQTQSRNYENLDQVQQEMMQYCYSYLLNYMHKQNVDDTVLPEAVQKFDRLRLQLQDGSCLDLTVTDNALLIRDRIRDRLQDGSCRDIVVDEGVALTILADQDQDQDQDRDRGQDKQEQQDRDQIQKKEPLRDGSCKQP